MYLNIYLHMNKRIGAGYFEFDELLFNYLIKTKLAVIYKILFLK